ncbi:hypothetical protein PIB30_070891 [Stylosanthes scabra]|uniref:Uncharacterized protein n=1 Tax=Stylosanthes scabra TaxID=79078 RepID=A0ABU6YP02_9FABA|nr:hypothetical protein [Stylosanthes scabra]
MNGGVVHVYYKHGVSKPYVVEDYVSTAVAANADNDDIAEVDEATFLKTKASNKSSPPKPNPPSNTKPTPTLISPKASQKSSPPKPHPKNNTQYQAHLKRQPQAQTKAQPKKDSTYKPCEVETSSDDDVAVQLCKAKKRLTQSQKASASAHQPKKHSALAPTKERHNILQDDDGLVEDDSDEEIGHGLRDVVLDALDPGADLEESDSWHLEESKTPLILKMRNLMVIRMSFQYTKKGRALGIWNFMWE